MKTKEFPAGENYRIEVSEHDDRFGLYIDGSSPNSNWHDGKGDAFAALDVSAAKQLHAALTEWLAEKALSAGIPSEISALPELGWDGRPVRK